MFMMHKSIAMPTPEQALPGRDTPMPVPAEAPAGELNEKSRGSTSSMVMPALAACSTKSRVTGRFSDGSSDAFS